MNNSAETDEKFIKKKLDQDINGGYILRQKPKKTWRRLSLFGHMKCKENQDSRTKRRTRYKYNKVVPAIANSSSMSEIEQEQQEEVALSLMMLSRDLGQWVAMNSIDETCANLESATMEKSSKRKFHCNGEIKQKKLRINGGCTENGELVEEAPMAGDEDERRHECGICFKVFTSGQALGGHKRSHLLTEARPKIHEFLDLNLPAPADEDETSAHAQCWVDGSHSHKHKALVA
ncbi:hypothetical protein V6N13_069852 [Hibiscus sabdariffa]